MNTSTTMTHCNFYINGQWTEPIEPGKPHPIVNPATEGVVGDVSMGGKADADRAVMAARQAFDAYSQTTVQYRVEMLEKLHAALQRRYSEMAQAISTEMGAPWNLAYDSQAECGTGHIQATLEAAKDFPFEVPSGKGTLRSEPVGVCVLITPWNWPMNQVMAKLAPALLTGCTVVLKPSEFAALSAKLMAELMDEVGYPAGVFNMVYGDGPVVGAALSAHHEVDMVSFTGSTGAGIAVAKAAADTVKRVVQELGGKSPNIIFADSNLEKSVARGVRHCFNNTGQSCNAPTRMLVERSVYAQAVEIAIATGAKVKSIQPTEKGDGIGPLAMKRQFDTVQRYIDIGMHCGARLVLGGLGRPEGFAQGYFVQPTIFADVTNTMPIAREEIFGPVLCMIPFDDEEDAIRIANDTPYGLAGYISTNDPARAQRVAKRLRAGNISVNASGNEYCNPFGGYKQSGNGREWGRFGIHDFIEYKIINGL
jgi:aldehyde dehydrogenase (NAD+)